MTLRRRVVHLEDADPRELRHAPRARVEPCADAPARLAGIWDGPRKASVQQAFAASGIAYAEGAQRDPEGRRNGLNCGELANSGRVGGVPKDRHSRYTRGDLFQQFQPFRA